jgi:phosphopantothenoylcysteine decarboxylase / phosphopantothenate---cysteine ligase
MIQTPERKRVILGVTGSIAAYKALELCRLFVSRGREVRVVMTPAASKFVAPLSFQAISGHRVLTDLWEDGTPDSMEHIRWGDWAESVVIAPATADFIAKYRFGYADTALHALLLVTRVPVVIAPAMNVQMWNNPQTQENVSHLKERGVTCVGPDWGDLACGWKGAGRLAEVKQIFQVTRRALSDQDFKGKKILITAGPTREALDPVRYLSNRSSGKMGIALAREAYRRGGDVTLIHGPLSRAVDAPVKKIQIDSTLRLSEEINKELFSTTGTPYDVVIMAAAVADNRPALVSKTKIKKADMPQFVELIQNVDILQSIGTKKNQLKTNLKIVGFAVETGDLRDLLDEVKRKLIQKNADLIIGNLAEEAFDLDTNRVWMVDSHGKEEEFASGHKSRVAQKILDKILRL